MYAIIHNAAGRKYLVTVSNSFEISEGKSIDLVSIYVPLESPELFGIQISTLSKGKAFSTL